MRKTSRAVILVLLMALPALVEAQNFRRLRDVEWQKDTIDLSESTVESLPKNALHSCVRLKKLVLPAGLKNIESQALFACSQLEEITIPKNVESIGQLALGGMKSLRKIVCLSSVPPKADSEAFAGTDVSRIKLVVSKESRDKYRADAVWGAFFKKKQQVVAAECADGYSIAPVPVSMKYVQADPILVNRLGRVVASDELAGERDILLQVLDEYAGYKKGKKSGVEISLAIDKSIGHSEGYRLTVSNKGISIAGNDRAGVFYGIMTLQQMLTPSKASERVVSLRCVEITDYPRTELRELMVDPCRIFIPLEDIKTMVPLMAEFKMNALHLHLVDDQAWRIQIDKYPLLTQKGSSRVGMDDMPLPISGYYTKDDMRELVAYAAKYHVTVIPEIEMPGHEVAAIHCYPELTCGGKQIPIRTTCGVSNELLCPGNDFTYTFLKDVFTELSEIFPSPYVHLGGDEAGNPALKCWSDCDKCQALLARLMGKAEGTKTPYADKQNWRLQEYMFGEIIAFLRDKLGKTPMFWYETDFKEIPSGCITFAWRHGLTKAAIDAAMRNNAQIVLCPGEHCYLDYPAARGDMPEVNWGMPVTTLQQTYKLDPAWGYDAAFEQNNLKGVAGTLWSECIPNITRLYYMAFPRAIALAEAGWSPQSQRNYDDFIKRIMPILNDLHRRGVCTGTIVQ